MQTPGTPEEMREMFEACAGIVRERGKDSVPMTSLAVSFGLVWHQYDEQEAAAFFDYLASLYGGADWTGPPGVPMNRRTRRRFRSWFS